MDEKVKTSSGVVGSSMLADMFSDATRDKFSRVTKPVEYFPVPKEPEVKVKKAKWKKVAREAAEKKGDEATADAAPATDKSKRERESKEVSATTGEVEESDEQAAGEITENAGPRTIFLGNVPLSATIKSIKKLCSEFGEVESVRLRSVPVAGTKVDEAGNQTLVRQVCANRRQFGDQKGSFNAYVVFKDAASVPLAMAANNRLLGTRHLRVDTATPTLFDPKRSVFVGSVPHYADEEELRSHFAAALVNGHDDIENIRIVRDPETLIGKGIAYVLFKTRDSVVQALELHEKLFKKRAMRVTVCGKRTKRTYERDTAAADKEGRGQKRSRGDDSDEDDDRHRKGKYIYADKSAEINATSAQKRIKLKAVNTRKKFLIANKQKKAVPGKKGKRLGGVVKRAMKAARTK